MIYLKRLLILLLILPNILLANNAVIKQYIENHKLIGKARMTYWLWDVYDAYLYAPDGKWSWQRPFALKLVYLRDLNGDEIAKESVKQMRMQGFSREKTLRRWYKQMKRIFPNVTNGSQLIGIQGPDGETFFYNGTKLIGRVKDKRFAKKFFGIWLSSKTSEPNLRQKLLGRVR